MRRLSTLILVAMLLGMLSACGGETAPTPTVVPPAATNTTASAAPAATDTSVSATSAATDTAAPAAGATNTGAPGISEAPKSLSSPQLPHFDNVTLTLVGDAGHNLKPLEFWKDDIKKAGITVNVVEVPFEGVYEKEKTEFVGGTGAFDVVIFYPAYIGDFAGNGYLEQLDSYVTKQPAAVYDPKLSDVIPPFLELYCKFDGKLFALPYDGDVLNLEYRKDLFENADERAAYKAKYGKDLTPPATWEDWLQVGQFFTRKAGEKLAGQTLDKPFYGLAEYGKRGFSFAWFLNRFAGAGGIYFDENMKPKINTPEAVKGLQNMIDSLKVSPPDVLGYGYDELRDAFLKGNVAMVVQWSDVPKKSEDPQQSTIAGKVGVTQVPGYMVNGAVNHRAMMPVGRVIAVSKDSKNKEAAYWLAKYLSNDRGLEDVSTTLTGLDPYRTSHFQNPGAYTMFSTGAVQDSYLKGVQSNLSIGFPEIFIPGAAQYEDALDLHVNKALAGQETAQQALDATATEWEATTDKLGRDKQINLWKAALGTYKQLGLIK